MSCSYILGLDSTETSRNTKNKVKATRRLGCLLSGETGRGVGDLDAELGGSLNDGLARAGVEIVGNDSGKLLVVHEKKIDVLGSLNHEGVETILKLEAGGLIASITDLRHQFGAAELSADSVIDTSGFAPTLLDTVETIRLETRETIRLLLHDTLLELRHSYFYSLVLFSRSSPDK